MRAPQFALCAAVAACAVTTAPAYGEDARGAGTEAVNVTPAPATAAPAPGREVAPRAEDGSAGPAGGDRTRTGPAAKVTQRGELSSTSAVGLVLAGGAVLVVAGQLLRLRLRLRRERQGGEADES
ncbi:hypothetical protein [Streptomyces sp. BP-8]|uniref:Tat pathway signal sequence domain protein n=1 Tax=Streptomyces sirii TaxID=3127701 RepID=A0ABZ2QLD4_9ACTN